MEKGEQVVETERELGEGGGGNSRVSDVCIGATTRVATVTPDPLVKLHFVLHHLALTLRHTAKLDG